MTEQYQVFVLPTDWDGATSIRALEVQPGNHNVAHHAILGLDVSVRQRNWTTLIQHWVTRVLAGSGSMRQAPSLGLGFRGLFL